VLIPSLLIVQESTPHELPARLSLSASPREQSSFEALERPVSMRDPAQIREPVTEVVPQLDPAPGDLPPLPRRTRQASIAPQLTEDASLAAVEGNGNDGAVQPDDAERSRSQLAAFQQGTARAREVEEHGAPAVNGHRT